MHIPDNYLNPSTCATFVAFTYMEKSKFKGKERNNNTENAPSWSSSGIFIFNYDFNIPLPGGTTGHTIGG